MTNNEAIDMIRSAQAEVEWEYPMDFCVAFDIAIKALEKQKPTKPLDETWTATVAMMGKKGRCPVCGKLVSKRLNMHFCGDCGQALEWTDMPVQGDAGE